MRNSPLGKALLGISRKWRKEIQTAYCSRPHIALGAVEPERGGKPESFCYSRCPQDGTRVPSGPRCHSKVAGAGSEGGLMWFWQKFCGIFLGTMDSMLQDASFQAEDTGVPSAFAVDWQLSWGGSVF